jgi:hypothetical protein
MQILIIGINHQIQPVQIKSASSDGKAEEFERDQKERFGALLRTEIQKRGVQLVAEEALHGEETVTGRVCQIEKCKYANVEMTPEERASRNIPAGYNEDIPNLSEDEKERCNREREEHVVTKTLAAAGDANSVIMVCGRFHTNRLATLFHDRGHTVQTTDLQNQPWYIEDWTMHIMLNL